MVLAHPYLSATYGLASPSPLHFVALTAYLKHNRFLDLQQLTNIIVLRIISIIIVVVDLIPTRKHVVYGRDAISI